MNMTITNAFLTFTALGYGPSRLLPIIVPDATISERSSLHKRVGTEQDPRGKTPGVKNRAGEWHSFDWVPYEADETDLTRWHAMGAGVGVKTGGGLIAIDADTDDMDEARTVKEIVEAHLGKLPIRVGRYPKALYLCRVEGDYRYTRVDFGARRPNGTYEKRVEILSAGRQFVAHGVHPATRQPYSWPKEIVPFAELPTFSPQQIDAFMEALRLALPKAAEKLTREGGDLLKPINQESLAGDLETVTKAVHAIRNRSADFPSRESYRDFGYAIKAALPDNEPEAFELFADWCLRWEDGQNDVDVVASDWRRMKPPFRRGAGWLYEMAERLAPERFSAAEHWFDVMPDVEESPFETAAKKEAAAAKSDDVYPIVTVDDVINRPPPRWLIERHVPEQGVGFLYSEPGIGKSFLALDLTLALSCGLPDWHGDTIARPDGISQSPVIYIASEGSFGLRNRILAWLKIRKISPDQAKRFLIIEHTINFMNPEDVQRLVRTARAAARALGAPPAMFVVDTVSRALPGADENLQKDMTLFVEACGALQRAFGCAVLGVHHAGKNGDMRGSTVLRGAGDFVFRLSRKMGASVGLLACEKMKDGPDQWEEPYRFDTVGLDGGETSLVVAREDASVGPSCELTPARTASVLGAMDAAWKSGEPWAKAPQSGERRAVRRMVTDHGFDAVSAEATLDLWERSGVIALVVADRNSKRKGYQVQAMPGQAVPSDGIFS